MQLKMNDESPPETPPVLRARNSYVVQPASSEESVRLSKDLKVMTGQLLHMSSGDELGTPFFSPVLSVSLSSFASGGGGCCCSLLRPSRSSRMGSGSRQYRKLLKLSDEVNPPS